jgi:hypothetical protein
VDRLSLSDEVLTRLEHDSTRASGGVPRNLASECSSPARQDVRWLIPAPVLPPQLPVWLDEPLCEPKETTCATQSEARKKILLWPAVVASCDGNESSVVNFLLPLLLSMGPWGGWSYLAAARRDCRGSEPVVTCSCWSFRFVSFLLLHGWQPQEQVKKFGGIKKSEGTESAG